MFDLSRETLEAHSLDMRQFIDARQSVLSGGMRVVDVYNGSGLTFTLLPDRGLDVWSAHYAGMPLTWLSPGSPHAADYGSSWLRQFNGGLLTTCGLRHSGPPEVDDQTGEQRDIHGNYTRLRAAMLRCEGRWIGDEYVLELAGRLEEGRLFGEQFRLDRTIRVTLGVPGLEIRDEVTNRSDEPQPFMLLYHVNVGYPLVRSGARLDVPAVATHPRDDTARAGFDSWEGYEAAIERYAEQVFFHHVRQVDGTSKVLLSNGDVGLMLAWDTTAAPYLTQWKNVRKGIYVCGLEPANCVPEGLNAARRSGRLVTLEPGETHRFSSSLRVLDGDDALARGAGEIEDVRRNGEPVAGFHWRPR